MFRPRATVAKMRMLTPRVAYWSSVWVSGKAAAAAKAPTSATLRCLVVSAVKRASRPALLRAAKPKPAVMRKPRKSSWYGVVMP